MQLVMHTCSAGATAGATSSTSRYVRVLLQLAGMTIARRYTMSHRDEVILLARLEQVRRALLCTLCEVALQLRGRGRLLAAFVELRVGFTFALGLLRNLTARR